MSKKPIYIGQMDKRVELISYTKTQTETGAEKRVENTPLPIWASIKDESGNEVIEGQVVAVNTRIYIIRFNQDVATFGAEMEIKDVNDYYSVLHVEQLGRKEYLQLKTQLRE